MIDKLSWITVYPELVLLVMGCLIAMVDLAVTSRHRTLTYVLTLATLGVVAFMQALYASTSRWSFLLTPGSCIMRGPGLWGFGSHLCLGTSVGVSAMAPAPNASSSAAARVGRIISKPFGRTAIGA